MRFIVRNSGARGRGRYEPPRCRLTPTAPKCPMSHFRYDSIVTTRDPVPISISVSRHDRPVQRARRHRDALLAEPHGPARGRDPSPLPRERDSHRGEIEAVRQARLDVDGADEAAGHGIARGMGARRAAQTRSGTYRTTRRDPGRGREAHRVQGARQLPEEERARQGTFTRSKSFPRRRRGRSRGIHRRRPRHAQRRRRARSR